MAYTDGSEALKVGLTLFRVAEIYVNCVAQVLEGLMAAGFRRVYTVVY